MTSGAWVFDRAVELMDEKGVGAADVQEYRVRTLGILNVLRQELYPYSDTFDQGMACPELLDFDQPVPLDDVLAQGVLPYGLAAHLLLGERDEEAAFFQQRYQVLLRELGAGRMAAWEIIEI